MKLLYLSFNRFYSKNIKFIETFDNSNIILFINLIENNLTLRMLIANFNLMQKINSKIVN